jgi:hypothetical protein
MTTEYKDEMFNTIHNLTLCIELEITTTQIFVKTESEFLSITGYPKKALWLTQFGEMFTRIIVNPFYDNVWIPIIEEKDNPDSMDYLFGYAAMKHFFNEFGQANYHLKRNFADSYTLSEINKNIDHAYPSIDRNPKLFPHYELITYLKPKK